MSSIAGINTTTEAYAAYNNASAAKPEEKKESGKAGEKSSETAGSSGAVYEKSESENDSKTPYTVNKMSAEARASLVEKLKQEQANRESQLLDIVKQMMTKQVQTYGNANSIWQFLAKGNFTVDAETKLQAQKDIAEDGYYGVSKTAQRIFDFASALAGDDVDKMKKMQEAFEKGFKQAENIWGGEGKLPSISYDTHDKVNKMFEDYYSSKEKITEDTAAADAQ